MFSTIACRSAKPAPGAIVALLLPRRGRVAAVGPGRARRKLDPAADQDAGIRHRADHHGLAKMRPPGPIFVDGPAMARQVPLEADKAAPAVQALHRDPDPGHLPAP
jgi:hypothetical protein